MVEVLFPLVLVSFRKIGLLFLTLSSTNILVGMSINKLLNKRDYKINYKQLRIEARQCNLNDEILKFIF